MRTDLLGISMSPAYKAHILAEALPYIRAYHGRTLVIRFGGNAMADPALKVGFARDVALLRLVGMKPIVVHGGGWRIDELARQMGIEPRRHRGVRVTDERTLTIIEMALGELNRRRDEFLSVISHELRTPLATLQGYIDLLARRCSERTESVCEGGRNLP